MSVHQGHDLGEDEVQAHPEVLHLRNEAGELRRSQIHAIFLVWAPSYFDISVPYFVANIALNLTFVCSEQVIEGVFIKPERSEGVV